MRLNLIPWIGLMILWHIYIAFVLNFIKVKVLSHIDQVFLGCAIYKPWVILISQGVF